MQRAATWVLLALCATGAGADLGGMVRDEDTLAPIAGARVHIQNDASAVVVTAADGSFLLPADPADPVIVTAAVTYDPDAADNWVTGGTFAPVANGTMDIEIQLAPIPADNPAYLPPTVDASCVACHNTQVMQWQSANHSLAATDFWVRDLYSGDGSPGGGNGFVFRDTHPGETGFCASCHAPMADVFDPGQIFLDEVVDPAALEGVSCIACHQIDEVNDNVNGLHVFGNATYRFPDGMIFATSQYVWGPLDDVTFGGMRASYAPIFLESQLCASCHQYAAPFGQTTFDEWLASPFAVPGPAYRTCQDCHMLEQPAGPICQIGGQPDRPPERNREHGFVGSTPDTLANNLALDTTVQQSGASLVVRAEVTNFGAGHDFPTGVSIRNALLLVEATLDGQPLAQIGGPTVPGWADDEVPGTQPGDYGGLPGKGFAKILEGRINDVGPVVSPVLFIDADTVQSKTVIPSGETDLTAVLFALPADAQAGEQVAVSTRLLYRRTFRAIAVTKGWTETPQGGPIEIEVASSEELFTLGEPVTVLDIPTLDSVALAALAALLALAALAVLRRRG